MSDKFTSSNGGTVEMLGNRRMIVTDVTGYQLSESASVKSHSSWLDPAQIETLREFFQHERDQELGRWRWPENPDYVVYPFEGAGHTGSDYQECAVLNEKTGQRQEFGSDLPQCNGGHFREAARAYFAAHPEPKPWHDAKPGEVWAVSNQDGEHAYTVDPEQFYDGTRDYGLDITDAGITAARRIWPEVSDGA